MTIASLAASAVFGIAAVLLVRGMVRSNAAPGQAVLSQPREETVPVVIAARKIAYGEALKPRVLKLVQWPKSRVPEGAFSSLDDFAAKDKGWRSALVRMAANEPVLAFKVSGEGQRQSLSSLIGEDMRAFAVRIDQTSGVGGFILPGDTVDVVLVRNLNSEARTPKMVSDVVVQNVKVLGVDQNADATSEKTKVAKTATIEVTVRDAQRLALAARLGDLTLVLRRAGAAKIDRARRVSVADLGSVAPPRGHHGPRARRLQVAVVRPGSRKMVRVAAEPALTYRAPRTEHAFAQIDTRLEGGARP